MWKLPQSHIFSHSIYEIIFNPAPLFSYKIKALENTRETSIAQSHLSKRTSTSVPLFALTLCLGRTDTESTANQLSILPLLLLNSCFHTENIQKRLLYHSPNLSACMHLIGNMKILFSSWIEIGSKPVQDQIILCVSIIVAHLVSDGDVKQ